VIDDGGIPMVTRDEDGGAGTRPPRGIFERPTGSGIWWARYADETGRVHRERVGTKGLALKVYQKRKNEIQERRFFPERIRRRDVQFKDMVEDFLTRAKGLRSHHEYARAGKVWKEIFKRKTLREIAVSDIERYVAVRIREVAPATVNRQLAFLKRLFNVAIADGKIEANPVRGVKFFKENNRRVRYLSRSEETALREAIGEEEWPKVLVALDTGFRRKNVFGLRWTDVNFEAGTITARDSKSGEDYHVPMSEDLRVVLRTLPSRLKSAWVFPSPTGLQALDAQNFRNRTFLPALARAEIAGFRWHDLRHTFASRLVMAGVDLATVQSLMGHKTVEMTMRYAHLSPGHRHEAVQRLKRRSPTDTTTGTSENARATEKNDGAKVVDLTEEIECARTELNRQPTDSKSAALSN